jgi:molecular chaperone GrpE
MKPKKSKTKDKDKNLADAKMTPEEMHEQIEILMAEKQDMFEKFQRVSADYINYQNRAPRQIADSVAYEKKAIIRSLLPSLDNIDHALAGVDSAKGPEALDGVIKGIRMVFDHMLDALKTQGVEQIPALDCQFDPAMHEAMQTRAEQDKPDNIVLEEFQKGYTLNGQVLRPSKVIVNKLPAKETSAEENKTETPSEDNTPKED